MLVGQGDGAVEQQGGHQQVEVPEPARMLKMTSDEAARHRVAAGGTGGQQAEQQGPGQQAPAVDLGRRELDAGDGQGGDHRLGVEQLDDEAAAHPQRAGRRLVGTEVAAVAGDLDGEIGDIEAPHQADIDQGIFPYQAGARPAKQQQEHEHRDANPEEEAKGGAGAAAQACIEADEVDGARGIHDADGIGEELNHGGVPWAQRIRLALYWVGVMP